MEFKEFAKNCPWAGSEFLDYAEDLRVCNATFDGCPGICREEECGLWYMLNIAKGVEISQRIEKGRA